MNINKKLLFTACTYATVFILGYFVKYGVDAINAKQAQSKWKICNDLGKTYESLSLKKSAEYGFVPGKSVLKLEPVVPTAEAAASIANTVFSSRFSSKYSKRQMPYEVILVNDVIWIVKSLNHNLAAVGGTSDIWIQKSDGRVLNMFNYK